MLKHLILGNDKTLLIYFLILTNNILKDLLNRYVLEDNIFAFILYSHN